MKRGADESGGHQPEPKKTRDVILESRQAAESILSGAQLVRDNTDALLVHFDECESELDGYRAASNESLLYEEQIRLEKEKGADLSGVEKKESEDEQERLRFEHESAIQKERELAHQAITRLQEQLARSKAAEKHGLNNRALKEQIDELLSNHRSQQARRDEALQNQILALIEEKVQPCGHPDTISTSSLDTSSTSSSSDFEVRKESVSGSKRKSDILLLNKREFYKDWVLPFLHDQKMDFTTDRSSANRFLKKYRDKKGHIVRKQICVDCGAKNGVGTRDTESEQHMSTAEWGPFSTYIGNKIKKLQRDPNSFLFENAQ